MSPVTRDEFKAAFVACLKLNVEALQLRADADAALEQMHRLAAELLKATGNRTLGDVFADDPAMLEALQLEM